MARWTEEQNASRSRKLSGRRHSLEHRAALHATALHGRTHDDRWREAYAERLALLRLQERIVRELEAGATLEVPSETPRNHQLAQLIRSATVTEISVDRLLNELEARPMSPETLVSLSSWLSEPAQDREHAFAV